MTESTKPGSDSRGGQRRRDYLKPKHSWQSPATALVVLSSLVSLIALGVSIRGCRISEESYQFSVRDFQAVRTVVYQGRVGRQCE